MSETNSTVEIWKPIVGLEGRYSISSNGRVRRDLRGRSTCVGKILKLKRDVRGYQRIGLCVDRRNKEFTVHRLVAEAFIGKRPKAKQINHKNGIKDDNRPENLEYVTGLENVRHARNVLHAYPIPHGENNGRSKLTWEQVRRIRRSYIPKITTRPSLAKRYGVSRATIDRVLGHAGWAE